MKSKKLIIGIFAAIIFVVGGIIFFTSEDDNKFFKETNLSKSYNKVNNVTEIAYLDTVVHVGLEELDIANTTVTIIPADDDLLDGNLMGDIKLDGFVTDNGYGNYSIYVKKGRYRSEYIDIFVHELLHIKQYEKGKLKQVDHDTFIFKGDTMDVNSDDYKYLPWEIAVKNKQDSVESKLKDKLY